MRHCYRDSGGLWATASLMHICEADDPTFTLNGWLITGVFVRPDDRGKGAGTRLLKDIIADAEREGENLYLTVLADSSNGLNDEQLRDWYMRHGFKSLGEQLPERYLMERIYVKN